MIQQPLILVHEESLRMTHPVFHVAPRGTRVVYVWDDAYFVLTGYSLKRLIFIYETLCGLEVDIIRGDTRRILHEMNPSLVYIPLTNNPLLLEMIASVREVASVEMVADIPFVDLEKTMEFKRFFQYWRRAEKKAFLHDGCSNA
ncbi:MAG: hypothetical protein EBY16_02210 [Gammaproteobacteria bacterium]|nr:hypothetical protein [Gammaproteobacteria bacterium]